MTEASTLRHSNTISALPSLLPHELLAEIFNLACPPIDFRPRVLCELDGDEDDFDESRIKEDRSGIYPTPMDKHNLSYRYMPLTLSAVCSRWRGIALSSPLLWSTFALEVISRELKSQVPLLRFYLTNTGSRPFSLDLDIQLQQHAYVLEYGKQAPRVERKELQPLANLIFQEFPEKIGTLRVAGAPPGWMCFLSQRGLPNLKDLAFTWGHSSTITAEEGACSVEPHECLRFCGSVSALRPLPGLPPLTVLHLRNVYTDICVKILLSCPHLTEYHCYTPESRGINFLSPFPRLEEPFTLPNLKRFGWMSPDFDEWNTSLLKNIQLPNLEELQWCGFPELTTLGEDEDVMFRFFSKLPKTIHTFTYYDYILDPGDAGDSPNHLRLLSHLPSVRSLAFHKCTLSFMKAISYLLIDRSFEMESTPLLPCLDTITLRNYRDNEDGQCGCGLTEILKKRKPVPGISHLMFEGVDCEYRVVGPAFDKRDRGFAYIVSATPEGVTYSYYANWKSQLSLQP